MWFYNQDGAPCGSATQQRGHGAHREWDPQDWKQVVDSIGLKFYGKDFEFPHHLNRNFFTILKINTVFSPNLKTLQ